MIPRTEAAAAKAEPIIRDGRTVGCDYTALYSEAAAMEGELIAARAVLKTIYETTNDPDAHKLAAEALAVLSGSAHRE